MDALEALKKEDHYILVMVDQAFGFRSSLGTEHRLRDWLIYIGVGIGFVLVLLLASMWKSGR
jgi:multisubunit Na+/H+ antiporter MnhB subunit